MLPSLEGGQQNSPAVSEDCNSWFRAAQGIGKHVHTGHTSPLLTQVELTKTPLGILHNVQAFPSETVTLEGSSASLLSKNYAHIIFKNQGIFLSFCTTSHPETESRRGQHRENRGSMCMIPYQSKGLLNHVESYCDCSVHNWNWASV